MRTTIHLLALALAFVAFLCFPALAAEPGAVTGVGDQLLPLASLALAAIVTIVHVLHSLGISRAFSAHLRDMAKQPGNKLAPIEDALAAHIDAGDDEAALNLLKGALGVVGKK